MCWIKLIIKVPVFSAFQMEEVPSPFPSGMLKSLYKYASHILSWEQGKYRGEDDTIATKPLKLVTTANIYIPMINIDYESSKM